MNSDSDAGNDSVLLNFNIQQPTKYAYTVTGWIGCLVICLNADRARFCHRFQQATTLTRHWKGCLLARLWSSGDRFLVASLELASLPASSSSAADSRASSTSLFGSARVGNRGRTGRDGTDEGESSVILGYGEKLSWADKKMQIVFAFVLAHESHALDSTVLHLDCTKKTGTLLCTSSFLYVVFLYVVSFSIVAFKDIIVLILVIFHKVV